MLLYVCIELIDDGLHRDHKISRLGEGLWLALNVFIPKELDDEMRTLRVKHKEIGHVSYLYDDLSFYLDEHYDFTYVTREHHTYRMIEATSKEPRIFELNLCEQVVVLCIFKNVQYESRYLPNLVTERVRAAQIHDDDHRPGLDTQIMYDILEFFYGRRNVVFDLEGHVGAQVPFPLPVHESSKVVHYYFIIQY